MTISAIRVGRRYRHSVGDVRTLAASIRHLGLLHPIVVDGNNRLVVGPYGGNDGVSWCGNAVAGRIA